MDPVCPWCVPGVELLACKPTKTHLCLDELASCCSCGQTTDGQLQPRHALQHVEQQPPAGRVVLLLARPEEQSGRHHAYQQCVEHSLAILRNGGSCVLLGSDFTSKQQLFG